MPLSAFVACTSNTALGALTLLDPFSESPPASGFLGEVQADLRWETWFGSVLGSLAENLSPRSVSALTSRRQGERYLSVPFIGTHAFQRTSG